MAERIKSDQDLSLVFQMLCLNTVCILACNYFVLSKYVATLLLTLDGTQFPIDGIFDLSISTSVAKWIDTECRLNMDSGSTYETLKPSQ